MMKKIMPKKRLISLFAVACILYGCSSAPVSSPKTETTAAIQSEKSQEEKTETEETKAEESKDKDSDSEESKNGQENEQSAENAEERKEDKESESDSETNEGDKESSDKSSGESSKDDDKEKDEKKDKFIQTVKNAHPESFSGCTYGKAFDEFFTAPQWDYFESTNGQDVVEFTGECMYAGSPTKARMQFTVSSSSVVTTGALYYNNAPQTTKIITESLNRIFEQYAKAHDIAYTLPSAEAAKNSQTNALPPETQAENPSAQNTENQNTQSQNTENQNMQTQNTETQNTQTKNTENQNIQEGNTQTQNAPQTNAIQSGGAQAALSFAAWTNPNIGSWHSPSTGYYVIPYIDSAGNPSLRFANENTKDSSATVYYTDAVSAVTNDAGGLTYQAYLYKPSGENQQLVGMVEVTWNSSAELKSFSVKMINGNQTMDNSMAGSDYTFFGATN